MILKTTSNSKVASRSICLDTISESSKIDDLDGIYIGKSKICRIPFLFDMNKSINKNIAILGMSGSGKSYFLKSFMIRNHLMNNSSVLIIDWNNEYKQIVGFLGGKILKVGLDFKINLFDLYDMKNMQNIRNISDTIAYLLNLDKEESYLIYDRILTIKSRENLEKLNINCLISEFKKERDKTSIKLANKLLQLQDNPLFAEKTDFSIDGVLNGVISFDFSNLRDDTQRDQISKTVFKIITELMHSIKLDEVKGKKEKLIVLDEAWRLIKNSSDVGVLFREGRKYGFCIALATQIVDDINNEVISNSACLFLFRLQNESDYKSLQDSGVIDRKDTTKIMQLPIGSCLVVMALKENNRRNKFFIESTDGIIISSYTVKSGKMQTIVSYKDFFKCTNRLLVSDEIKDRIINFIEGNANEVDDNKLVELMINLHVERAEILHYLRSLGLKDAEIVQAYHKAAINSINR